MGHRQSLSRWQRCRSARTGGAQARRPERGDDVLRVFDSDDPFADFVVHEAAHVFHNCKRRTIGLPERGRREWILDIDFGRRETFAYACEAYSRLRLAGRTAAERRARLAEHAEGCLPPVDTAEYLDILSEAVEARNGWKRIHARCAPARRKTR